jgi:hypothetical protein
LARSISRAQVSVINVTGPTAAIFESAERLVGIQRTVTGLDRSARTSSLDGGADAERAAITLRQVREIAFCLRSGRSSSASATMSDRA